MAKGDYRKGEIRGSTRVHAQICHILGIKQLIVGVNKMDDKSVNYSQDRYNQIKAQVGKMLTKIGYKTAKIPFIPLSGYLGDNLGAVWNDDASENMPWWKGFDVKIKKERITGNTLYHALDKVIKTPKRTKIKVFSMDQINHLLSGYIVNHIDRPYLQSIPSEIIGLIITMMETKVEKKFRSSVAAVYRIKGVGDVVTGRVEQGEISPGTKVKFYPTGCTGYVSKAWSSIEMHHRTLDKGEYGDLIGIHLKELAKENMSKKGDIMVIDDEEYDPYPPKPVKEFTAIVFIKNHPGRLYHGHKKKLKKTGEWYYKGGYTPCIHVLNARAPCRMINIHWKIGRSTNNKQIKNPSYIEAGDEAKVVFKPERPFVVTEYNICPSLGRFVGMDGELMMIGRIVNVKY